jgi:2-keto-4-pentenoate hydratase
VVAALLGRVGERLRAGDLLITGSVVQVPLAAGDEVAAEIDGLGRVSLAVTAG